MLVFSCSSVREAWARIGPPIGPGKWALRRNYGYLVGFARFSLAIDLLAFRGSLPLPELAEALAGVSMGHRETVVVGFLSFCKTLVLIALPLIFPEPKSAHVLTHP